MGNARSVSQDRSFVSKRRFGGNSLHQYTTKVRWLVGTLVTLILLLGSALTVLFQEFRFASAPSTHAANPTPAVETNGKVELLFAAKRIEAGEQLEPSFFSIQAIAAHLVPQGALRATDLQVIRGQFAKDLILPGFPMSFENLSVQPPVDDFPIPPGYRAISIPIDEVSSVSYKVRANHRVDVLLSFIYEGKPAVIPVVETAKVLAMGMDTDPKVNGAGSRTATLLVSSEDARKIELAKQHGKLSLVRAGDTEVPKPTTDSNPTTFEGLFRPHSTAPKPAEKDDGKMFVTDPRTGRQTAYVLKNGEWRVSRE